MKVADKIKLVHEIANDYDIKLTDKEARKALKICGYDYERLKEYFIN